MGDHLGDLPGDPPGDPLGGSSGGSLGGILRGILRGILWGILRGDPLWDPPGGSSWGILWGPWGCSGGVLEVFSGRGASNSYELDGCRAACLEARLCWRDISCFCRDLLFSACALGHACISVF